MRFSSLILTAAIFGLVLRITQARLPILENVLVAASLVRVAFASLKWDRITLEWHRSPYNCMC